MICTWPVFGINTTLDISKLSQITYNNFEISLVVFMPYITTNHAITYTNTAGTFFRLFWRRSCWLLWHHPSTDNLQAERSVSVQFIKRLLTISSQINKVSEYITFQWFYFEKGCRKKCTFYRSQLFPESTIRLKTANLLCKSTLSYST